MSFGCIPRRHLLTIPCRLLSLLHTTTAFCLISRGRNWWCRMDPVRVDIEAGDSGQIFWQMKFGSCGSLRLRLLSLQPFWEPLSSCTETSAMSSHQAPSFALLHMLLFWLPRTSFQCSGEDYSRLASRRGAILPCLKGLRRVFVDMVSPVVRCITARLDGEAVCTGQFQVDSVPTCTWCFSVPRICWREHLLETKWRMLTLRVSSAV